MKLHDKVKDVAWGDAVPEHVKQPGLQKNYIPGLEFLPQKKRRRRSRKDKGRSSSVDLTNTQTEGESESDSGDENPLPKMGRVTLLPRKTKADQQPSTLPQVKDAVGTEGDPASAVHDELHDQAVDKSDQDVGGGQHVQPDKPVDSTDEKVSETEEIEPVIDVEESSTPGNTVNSDDIEATLKAAKIKAAFDKALAKENAVNTSS